MKKIFILLFLYVNIFAAGQIGDRVTSFQLPNLYNLNKNISFNDYKGKVVLLNIWASWCSGCKQEMPLFVKLQNELKNSSFRLLLSNIDKNPQNAISFLKKIDSHKILDVLCDADKTIPKEFRCIGMPSSYLIDKNGKIVDVIIGRLNKNKIVKLKAEINALMKNNHV
jgi:thiol-disulfide isomerase/thioredoxin